MNSIKIAPFYLFMVAVLFSACRKEYSLEGSGLKIPSGTWEFKDSLKQFQGNMDTAYFSSITGSPIKELHLIGRSDDGTQSFHLHLFADTFKTGIYKASLFQSSFEYTIPAKTLYQADQLIGEFIVTITSFGTNNISGTFSGAALDSANSTKNVSQGKFTSTIGTSGSVSSGVLGDSSGICKPVTLAGIYTQGIALTSANTMQVTVTVAVAGTYSIATNTVNGVTFSKAGTFTSTGSQNIVLNGIGTPINAGVQNFVLRYGNSTCNFGITCLPGVMPSGDYFPLSLNTNWTYGLDGGTPSDSVHFKLINYSPSFGGNTYKTITIDGIPPSGDPDSGYYRKNGGDYFQYVNYDDYFTLDQPAAGEFIFLKDNVAAGTTWQSPDVSVVIGSIPLSVYFKMTLLEKAVPVNIGNFNFPDVIKVRYEFFVVGSPVALETDERWFAKNVGEIHFEHDDGTTPSIHDIGSYQIF